VFAVLDEARRAVHLRSTSNPLSELSQVSMRHRQLLVRCERDDRTGNSNALAEGCKFIRKVLGGVSDLRILALSVIQALVFCSRRRYTLGKSFCPSIPIQPANFRIERLRINAQSCLGVGITPICCKNPSTSFSAHFSTSLPLAMR